MALANLFTSPAFICSSAHFHQHIFGFDVLFFVAAKRKQTKTKNK